MSVQSKGVMVVVAHVTALAVTLGCGLVTSVQAQTPALKRREPVMATGTATAQRAVVPMPEGWNPPADVAADLERVYMPRNWAPLWSHDGVVTLSGRAMVDALADLESRGLDPRDYDVDRLSALRDSGRLSESTRIEFESALSTASMRVLRALRTGRVAVSDAHPRLRFASDSADYALELQLLAQSMRPGDLLDEHEPPFQQYRLLKAALADYRERARTDRALVPLITRITLAMERWRWLPTRFASPTIIVNIPEYRMYMPTGEGRRGEELISMGVVVGDARGSHTPVFTDSLRYIVFAPNWNVPASIVKSELLPIGKRDPYLLSLNNYQIVDGRGKVLPMNAESVKALEANKAWIRQLPGGTNSLGRVKFMFPNEFDVYMHDSPVQNAFALDRRDMSHGCIRLSQPDALARLLLRNMAGWDSTRIETAMNGTDEVRVDLAAPIPVHMMYATAVGNEDGTVTFLDDIYGQDPALATLLVRGYEEMGVAAARSGAALRTGPARPRPAVRKPASARRPPATAPRRTAGPQRNAARTTGAARPASKPRAVRSASKPRPTLQREH